MRWNHQPAPRVGDSREVRRFLLWPKRIGNETRWLETTSWVEVYCQSRRGAYWHQREWSACP